MWDENVFIKEELYLNIRQCLLGTSTTMESTITHVLSHPQPLAQCQQFIQSHFPDADILVSTWDNEDTSMIPCRVIKTKPPELSGIHSSTVDFQIIGTQKGLQNIMPMLVQQVMEEMRSARGALTS